MKTIDWLLSCDPAVAYLSRRDLLEEKQNSPYSPDEGWIKRLYEHVDPVTHLWAGGVYSPKYNSTHYTLHTLWSLQASPSHEAFQLGVDVLLKHLWPPKGEVRKHHYQDLCVSAMVGMLAVYAGKRDDKINEIIDYILAHKMPDGAFNCSWQRIPKPTMGSLHTTLLVLEMIQTLKEEHYSYRMDELLACIPDCVELILDRHMYKRRTNGEVIDRNMIRNLFPLGWRYTIIRAFDCFAKLKIVYDPRMEEGLQFLASKADALGRMKTEAPFSGQYFFRFESTREFSGFNSLRFLRILKHYRPTEYLQCMHQMIAP